MGTSLSYLLRNYLIKAHPLFPGCAACPDKFLPLRQRLPEALRPNFPVDVVYTWVDGADAQWAAKRANYLPALEAHRAINQMQAHYRDNQELRYSLRSLEQYAPWVRHIFIVTDAQKPSWLDTAHPKITVVDHREIIPTEYLPTFNSHVIEAYLYRISGLAEHYLYCNDDFFLSSPCTVGDFFTSNGLPYIFTDWRQFRQQGYLQADTPHSCSYHNSRAWLTKYNAGNGNNNISAPEVISAHVPYPQTLSNAKAAYAVYKEAVTRFSANKFRTNNEMAFYCHAIPLWAYAAKRAVPCDAPYYYINTKRFDRRTYYEALLREKGTATLPLFFCLNDVGEVGKVLKKHSWQKDMADFLEAFFPEPSAFESTLTANTA